MSVITNKVVLQHSNIQLYTVTIENSNDLEHCKTLINNIFRQYPDVKIIVSIHEDFINTHEKRVYELIKDLKYSYCLISENDMFVVIGKPSVY